MEPLLNHCIIIIGICIFILFILFICFCCFRRKYNRLKYETQLDKFVDDDDDLEDPVEIESAFFF